MGEKKLDAFTLGGQAQDTVTSFKGTIVGKLERYKGEDEICIQPALDKDGKWVEAAWLSVSRCAVI